MRRDESLRMQGPYRHGRQTWIDLLLAVVGVRDRLYHGVCDGGPLAVERRTVLNAMRRNVGLVHIECVADAGDDGFDLNGATEVPDVSLRRSLTAHRRYHMSALLSVLLSQPTLHFVPI